VVWRLKFHEGVAKVIPRVQYDHHLLVILSEGVPYNGGMPPFMFEAAWVTHTDFNRLIMENWEGSSDLIHTLSNLATQLKDWNQGILGNIFKHKKELLARLNGIQNSPHYGYSNIFENLVKYLQEQLEITLYQEECLWFQKSGSQWIAYGDRNTKYYHSKTIIRRRKNKKNSLTNNEGNRVDEPENLKCLVRRFYVDLFTKDILDQDHVVAWNIYPNSFESKHGRLCAPIHFFECKKVLFEMVPHKAPGEDGYTALFFQQCWDIVANSLFIMLIKFGLILLLYILSIIPLLS